MLNQLVIHNFTLIEHSEINWKNQLNVLTGETGAGKSILLSALKLLLGERADIKSIRNTEKKSVIEANFSITELNLQSFFEHHDLDYEDELIIRREILSNGKSVSFAISSYEGSLSYSCSSLLKALLIRLKEPI